MFKWLVNQHTPSPCPKNSTPRDNKVWKLNPNLDVTEAVQDSALTDKYDSGSLNAAALYT